MLARLGIRQKLTLLLAIPLAAIVLVMVPYVLDRADDAGAAGTTARIASAANEVGSLMQILQQERLLALGYLVAPDLDRSALVAQTQDAVDATAQLRADPLTAPVMARAARELNELTVVRENVVQRATQPLTVYSAFRNANTALLDALQLVNAAGVDAQGLTQLSALEALMRSNEEASSVGAVLVAAAADPTLSRSLLTDAQTADQQYFDRFHQLVPQEQAQLLDSVENGQAGQRIRQLIFSVGTAIGPVPAQVSDALTAAVTYAGLRRLAQDRVARDITTTADSRARVARTVAWAVAIGAVLVLIAVVMLGITVGRSIARPLRRLSRAAALVAELSRNELVRVADSDSSEPGPPQLVAVEVDSADEIGELAAVLNRVQATAALLLERQVTARDNVATMFANIARRTQNLAGRQLNLIDELAKVDVGTETQQRIDRLDQVATRLRRSADSLLVVSGTIDQVMSGNPSHLSDVIQAAMAEIEGFAAVQVGPVANIGVSANLVGDLRLLLAELLENATNFSPPGSPVEISATMGEECQVVITDHGVGLSPLRLQEENSRLVERERLDVAPTTVLGLFVVGRLARRHGLSVHLAHSPGRGVTATVRIPVRLLSTATRMVAIPSQRRPRRAPATTAALMAAPASSRSNAMLPAVAALSAIAAQPATRASLGATLAAVSKLNTEVAAIASGGPFGWFAPDPANRNAIMTATSQASTAQASTAQASTAPARAGVYGIPLSAPPAPAATSLPMATSSITTGPMTTGPMTTGPMTTGPQMAGAMPGGATTGNGTSGNGMPGSAVPTRPVPTPPRPVAIDPRTGLARRVPGTHMVGGFGGNLRGTGGTDQSTSRVTPPARAGRDPEAERDALNDYLSGLNRGSGEAGPSTAERPL